MILVVGLARHALIYEIMPPRIQIRPPRRDTPINVNETWQRVLEPAIKQLYGLKPTDVSSGKPPANLSFKQLYDSSYRLVTQGHGKTLYQRFIVTTKEYLESLPPLDGRSGNLLETLSSEWLRFQKRLELVRDVLMYLDRSYCDENNSPRTEQIGKRLFHSVVVEPVITSVFSQLVKEISHERSGQIINIPVLKSIVELLESLTDDDRENSPSLYDTKFRATLLAAAVDEYQHRLDGLSNLPNSYVKLLEIKNWLANESHRGESYLPPETTIELVDTIKRSVIDPSLSGIFSDPSGVASWVGSTTLTSPTQSQLDALRLSSDLELQCGPRRSLVKSVGEELVSTQRMVNSTANTEVSWVECTTQVREKYAIIAEAVGQEAWKTVLQPRLFATVEECSSGAEFLANYLNHYLRKSNTVQPEEIEPALERSLLIYPALRDRDTFGKIFQRLLARRLINNSTRSEALEISWLRRVREEEDASTSTTTDSQQFEKMVKDYYDSEKRAASMQRPGSEFLSVNILRTDLWPVSMRSKPSYDVKLPQKLHQAQSDFELAYKEVKQDRQLTWNYTLGNVDIRLNIGGKAYLIGAPVYCTAILMLFSDDEVYTAKEISEKTRIPLGGELERFLKSLYLVPGANLLTKIDGDRKDVSPSDSFEFNSHFSSPKSRIKLRVVGARATSKTELTPEEQDMLLKDRTDIASAVIVRLMKTHKTMSHAQLVQVAMDRLRARFRPHPQLLKTAIQYLLAKEYIERSDMDRSIYVYKA